MDNMVRQISIGKYVIGPGRPCFIIAEAGVNHNGNINMAKQLVDAAAISGANAIKFQTFKAERLLTKKTPKADYQVDAGRPDESQFEMLKNLELSEDEHKELLRYCDSKGIIFMSTPFDEMSVDLLESLGVHAFKIGSGDITNLDLISHVACKGKPIIISTGMSFLCDVERAFYAAERENNTKVILLHCISNYPTDPADVNLYAMRTISKAFDAPVGYSDHTLGIEISLAAVALGANVIEKHFTLDCSLPGPDHQSSLEPNELIQLVAGIRKVESALGNGQKKPAACEAGIAAVARKSLVAAKDIPSGKQLTRDMLAIMRPGTGLPPYMKTYLIGRTAKMDIPAGCVIDLGMIQ
jgi:N-acetylneuraminate synthase